MYSRVRASLKKPLLKNTLALYAVQLMGYAIPLLMLAYLTRVLEPNQYGLLAIYQSFALWMSLFIEYGFNYSATREVARHRNDISEVSRIVAGVLGAKGILALFSVFLSLMLYLFVPIFSQHPGYLFWSVMVALTQGFNPIWYFQGVEKVVSLAILDITSRGLMLIGLFLFVKSPQHGELVLAIQAGSTGVYLVLAFAYLYRHVPFYFPYWLEVNKALRLGFSMFIFRGAASLYNGLNALLLSFFVHPGLVGTYNAADKIVRALVNLLAPVTQSLFPRISHLVRVEPHKARGLARMSLVFLSVGGLLGGVTVYFLAPIIVRLLLGSGFELAIPIMRILALLLPIIAVGTALGIHWMLPLGLDRQLNTIVLFAGVINVLMVMFLVPSLGITGMAWSVVIVEAFVALAMVGVLWKLGFNPLYGSDSR